jgi:hypothetical protein
MNLSAETLLPALGDPDHFQTRSETFYLPLRLQRMIVFSFSYSSPWAANGFDACTSLAKLDRASACRPQSFSS